MKSRLNKSEINMIINLRQTGHSLPEIHKITNRGYGTVYRYIKDVKVLPQYRTILKEKQGGSKLRSNLKWQSAESESKKLIARITKKDLLFIGVCLYWAEGNKKELNLINSDPELMKVFIKCLLSMGVSRKDLKVTLRVYSDLEIDSAKKYWAKTLKIPISQISNVNVLRGKKEGKLKYGMCRVRVRKSEYYFKLIMSLINQIKLICMLP